MTPKALKALKSSIAEYEKKLAAFEGAMKVVGTFYAGGVVEFDNGKSLDFGAGACPLCQEFNSWSREKVEEEDCRGCAIAESTGRRYCERTPYSKISKIAAKSPKDIILSDLKQAVSAELDFLKSLLPEEANE